MNTPNLLMLWSQFLDAAQSATKNGISRLHRKHLCNAALQLSDKVVDNGFVYGDRYEIWKEWFDKLSTILEEDELLQRTVREYFLGLHNGELSEFSITFSDKTEGMSIGSVCDITFSGMHRRLFIKCPQRGPSSTSVSSANCYNSVNRPFAQEIYVYQLLSMIHVGGRVHFPVPVITTEKALYIATEEMTFTLGKKLTAATVNTKAIVLVDFLQFVLRLADVGSNEGNYGQTAEGNPIIVDFWINPNENYEYSDNECAEFWNVSHHCESRLIADVLKKLTIAERKSMINRAVGEWSLIEKLDEAKTEIEQFLIKNEKKIDVSGDLVRYVRDVKLNVKKLIG